LPRDLLESELFGHERGAFTGADRTKPGKFERAKGGTLFLDEIGELPLELQPKILRVLEEGIIDRLGGSERIPVDARVVLATNRDLEAAVQAGRFREDLFHRMNVVPILMPPLRERAEDIPLLAQQFLAELGVEKQVSLAPALVAELSKKPWPGNVRELKNLIERMVLLRRSDVLDLADMAPPGSVLSQDRLPESETHKRPASGDLRPGNLTLPDQPFSLPEMEKEIVLKALEKHKGNRSAAARYLGIPRHVLLYRLEKYDFKE
jgi:two-component system NtrC family response regulator